jgi:predicted enzyme related to lactoylglutathione lyase
MLGGFFIKTSNPKYLARWYEDNLGIGFGTGVYFSFKWRDLSDAEEINHTVFSFFKNDSDYFNPSENKFMLNFRVSDLDMTRNSLMLAHHWIDEKTEDFDYGRFGWTMDPNGLKIELWQAIDAGFEDRAKSMELFGKVNGVRSITLYTENVAESIQFYHEYLDAAIRSEKTIFNWYDFDKRNVLRETLFIIKPTTESKHKSNSIEIAFYVEDLDALLKDLKSSEIEVDPSVVALATGRSAWIYDPDGNRVELFEQS